MSFSDPSYNIEQFNLQSGMKVADFGAGSGFYALAAAKAVGDKGKVYAIDVQKDLLDKLKSEASHKGFHNVEVLWGDVARLGGTKLRDQSVDAVIIANLLFQIEEKQELVNETRRVLKPKGRVMLVDWSESYGGIGPIQGHVVNRRAGRDLFEPSGFVFERDIRAGSHHWGVVL